MRVGCGILLAFCLALGAPTRVAAQQGCRYADDGNDVLQSSTTPGGGRITNISNPHFLCDDGVEIWADSAVAYSEQAMSLLIGSVRYRDRTRELRANQARYFTEVGRLQAQGNVRVTNFEDGSVIENGDLVYLRETDFRDQEEMTVTTGGDGIRPRALVRPGSDSADADPGPPYSVEGQVIVLRGSDYFVSTGDVRIERDSLLAFGDSAEYRETDEVLVLVGSARVESGTYTLLGRTVEIGTATSDTSEIHALRDALLTGEDVVVNAPHIVLHLVDGAVERLVAVPLVGDVGTTVAATDSTDLARPVALTENVELTADSLELTAPGDVLERILAAGSARSVSHSRDSLNIEPLPDVARSDWMEGDTIVISLRPVADSLLVADSTAAGYEVERIVAHVDARSLYRLPPEDSTAVVGVDPPALHYVTGDSITLVMQGGEVRSMQVVGQTRGVHLEPLAPAASDSLDAVPDSVQVPGPIAGDDPGPTNDFSFAAATASGHAFIERRIQRPATGPRGRRPWNRR